MQKEAEHNILLTVGTFPPRECGIATFTKDLTDAVDKKFFPFLITKVVAMNNNGVNIYNYPQKVLYQISDTEKKEYIKIAEKINKDKSIKIVSIQHEFGIFGGEYGEYLIEFLKNLKKPKIITFHSVLQNPNEKRKQVVKEIAINVDEIVVMTEKGVIILKNDYEIKTPIKVIPHGIPNVIFESQKNAKKQLGYADKIILSSFGMISSGKGYEYVIESLPNLVKKFPNLIYLIVGATHPIVRKKEGEGYRNFLDKKIKELGLQNHVKFYNKYTTVKEIIQYLKATDIYISSSLTPDQITSGTLAYATGCGRVSVSTPFLHAQDLLKNGKGVILSDFGNSKSFENAIFSLLTNPQQIKEIEHASYAYTRKMTWQNVAISYGGVIKKYVEMPEIFFGQLPVINTTHIRKMTDNFGMLQFAKHTIPDQNSGYTLDDNSRALIVTCKLYAKYKKPMLIRLIKTYLKYIKFVQNGDGKIYNLVSKEKIIDKSSWSEEAHGRAICSLGLLTSMQIIPKEIKLEAEDILLQALPVTKTIQAPRALASIITGLFYYNKENYSIQNVRMIKDYANYLIGLYEKNSTEKWQWFEPELTYSNSKICESLFYAFMITQDQRYLRTALTTLNFLISKTFYNDIFVPIGQNGWHSQNGDRAYFDQQPIDVSSMVRTLIIAYKLSRNLEYEKRALDAFKWFLGKNVLKQVIYNEQTGGCYDGLGQETINLNQGAESTLSYLMARLTLEEIAN